jgi:tRNA pseudouridine55 synthase
MFIVDKPAGITSHDVVDKLRRIVGTRRVGHAGTLDPFATGVLLVCTGRTTRLIQFLSTLEKEYVARVRLGFATDTQDLTGKQITPLESSKDVSGAEVLKVLREFEGDQMQLPPMYSAKKVDGERLYRAAREGRDVERAPVRVRISSLTLLDLDGQQVVSSPDGTADFLVRVRCSSGTYVRTLAHDIGARLRVGGHLAMLRRTAIGHLSIDRAVGLEDLQGLKEAGKLRQAILTPSEMLAHLPMICLDPEMQRRIEDGLQVTLDSELAGSSDAESVRLCDASGQLVAVGRVAAVGEGSGGGRRCIKPKVVIGRAEEV